MRQGFGIDSKDTGKNDIIRLRCLLAMETEDKTQTGRGERLAVFPSELEEKKGEVAGQMVALLTLC